jgi:hypothetical protein
MAVSCEREGRVGVYAGGLSASGWDGSISERRNAAEGLEDITRDLDVKAVGEGAFRCFKEEREARSG